LEISRKKLKGEITWHNLETEHSLKEHELSTIFSYGYLEKTEQLHVTLDGNDKENKKWEVREIKRGDISKYEQLWSNLKVIKFYRQERVWNEDEIKEEIKRLINVYDKRHPLPGALTVLDECDEFLDYISPFEIIGKEIVKIGYTFLPNYWSRGIGKSVLKKFIEEWGT
jgi:RimJ/RimL family protein N-acetyltransferase